MRTIITIFIFMLLFASVTAASEQGVFIHDGFGTGQDFISMPPSCKRSYAMGVINGILLALLFGAPKENMNWFESYVENMTDVQVSAILSKFLEKNPGRWHDGLHTLMFSTIKEAYDKSRSTEKN